MDRETIRKKYEIVTSDMYKELRDFYLEHIISSSNSNLDDKHIRGMLLLINESDSWEERYKSAVNSYKNERNN